MEQEQWETVKDLLVNDKLGQKRILLEGEAVVEPAEIDNPNVNFQPTAKYQGLMEISRMFADLPGDKIPASYMLEGVDYVGINDQTPRTQYTKLAFAPVSGEFDEEREIGYLRLEHIPAELSLNTSEECYGPHVLTPAENFRDY